MIAAIAALGLAVAGCGSSKSSSSSSATSSAAPATTSSSSASVSTGSSTAAGSVAAFKAAFVANQAQLRQVGNDLGKALKGAAKKTDDQLAAEFQSLSVKTKAQATKLSQLSPPAQFKPTLDKLVTYLNSVGDKLQKISTDAKEHNATTAKADTIQLVQQSVLVQSAYTALTKALHSSS